MLQMCASIGSGAVGILIASAAIAQPAGMPRYTVIDLGMTEGTASSQIVSVGINNSNQVLGLVSGNGGAEAVIRSFTTNPHDPSGNLRFPSPDPINRSITPTAIDQFGTVTGYYTPSLVNRPFTIAAGTPSFGAINDIIGPFPGSSANAQRFDNANGMSDNGQHIVGTGGNSNASLAGWIRSTGGVVTQLPSTGYGFVTPQGVNNSGMTVGYASDGVFRALRWSNAVSEPVALADLGGSFGRAWAVNNSGYTVGEAYTPGGSFINHAVMWDPAGNILDLHAAAGIGAGTSRAIDINSSNWVLAGAGGSQRFLYVPGVGGATIQSLITSFGNMAILGGVTGINDLGYISAHGTDSVGRNHLFILVPNNPIPTPGAMTSLALGAFVSVRRRRR